MNKRRRFKAKANRKARRNTREAFERIFQYVRQRNKILIPMIFTDLHKSNWPKSLFLSDKANTNKQLDN